MSVFGETGSLPLSGGAALALALYAGASLLVTGQLVGGRMIEKMDWAGQCEAHIRAGIEAQRPAASALPTLGCSDMLGLFFGAEGARFCARHGGALKDNPVSRTLDVVGDVRHGLHGQRMDYAASRAGSRCGCAVTTTLENRRVPLAIYAGSGRLITPPSIGLLESDLVTALNGPACAMKG